MTVTLNMTNATDITLTGNKTKIIILPGRGILLPDTVNVTLNMLQLEYEDSATVDVLSITSSNSTVISNVNFTGMNINQNTTEASITCAASTVRISNCSFSGTKVKSDDSDVNFFGDNLLM